MSETRSHESLPPVEIHFGDVYEKTQNDETGKPKRAVIIELHQDDLDRGFHAGTIVSRNGKESLAIGGSENRTDILRIIDRWDLQRILQAILNHFPNSNDQETIDDLTATLEENSTKPSQIV